MSLPARYPGAVWRPVVNYSMGMASPTYGLVAHVQQGDGSLFGRFNMPANQVSSHLWVSKAGVVEQYVALSGAKAWAEAAGNPDWISVECEGFDTEDYTAAQVQALGAIYAWGAGYDGWPLQVCDDPGGRGLGTHSMGGAAWGGHACPGAIRASRRPDILAVAARLLAPPTPATLFDAPTIAQLQDAMTAVLNKATAYGQVDFAHTVQALTALTQTLDNLDNLILAALGMAKGDPPVSAQLAAIVAGINLLGTKFDQLAEKVAAQVGGVVDLAPVLDRINGLRLSVLPLGATL